MDPDSLHERIAMLESDRAANGGCGVCGNCSNCPYNASASGGYRKGTTRRYLDRSKNKKKCNTRAGKKKPKYWQEKNKCIDYGYHLIDIHNKSSHGKGKTYRQILSKYKSPRGKNLFTTDKKNILISKSGAKYVLRKGKDGRYHAHPKTKKKVNPKRKK